MKFPKEIDAGGSIYTTDSFVRDGEMVVVCYRKGPARIEIMAPPPDAVALLDDIHAYGTRYIDQRD